MRFFATELVARHKNAFAYVDRATFNREVAALDSAIPRLSDTQMRLRISRLAALLRDGHTTAAFPAYAQRLPISVLWLDDGPHVVGAVDEQQSLIGARIVGVNGRPIAEVADTMRKYLTHENELGFRIRSNSMLLRPAALRDAGLGDDSAAVMFEVEQNGARSSVRVPAVDAAAVIPPRVELPLYRQRASDKYWWTYVPESRMVFVKYNRCVDFEDFRRMADSVLATIDREHPLRVVVDIRDNPGGNSEVVQPLIEGLRSRGSVNRADALFVIMGRVTFSSGLLAAYDFKRKTRATLVGEPTGERPNSYGEVKTFKLPNSGVQVTYSTKYFQLVKGDPESYAPDVLVPPTAEAYIQGRDPALEWVLAHSRSAER